MGTQHTKQQAEDTQLILGLSARLPASFTTTLNGQSFTLAQILALVQARIDGRNKVTSTKGAHQLALAQLTALLASGKAPMVALKRLLLAMFATQEDALADLGIREPKVGTKSVATLVGAAVKARSRSTREARHTMGSKQKLSVTGASAPLASATAPGTSGSSGHS